MNMKYIVLKESFIKKTKKDLNWQLKSREIMKY